MGFSQWANGEGTLWGILWRWKGAEEDKWCIELFTTRNGWLHSVRAQVMGFGHQQQILVFEIPIAEFFTRAHTNYPRLPIDEIQETVPVKQAEIRQLQTDDIVPEQI